MFNTAVKVWIFLVHVHSFKSDGIGLPNAFMTPQVDMSTLRVYMETQNNIRSLAEQNYFATLPVWLRLFARESKHVAINLLILLTYLLHGAQSFLRS
jgi:hypothetical protein